MILEHMQGAMGLVAAELSISPDLLSKMDLLSGDLLSKGLLMRIQFGSTFPWDLLSGDLLSKG